VKDSKILRKVMVPQPINGRLMSDVEVECSVCEDTGWIRIEEMRLIRFERGESFHYVCPKHSVKSPERSGRCAGRY
jgi:hypothetical protein